MSSDIMPVVTTTAMSDTVRKALVALNRNIDFVFPTVLFPIYGMCGVPWDRLTNFGKEHASAQAKFTNVGHYPLLVE